MLNDMELWQIIASLRDARTLNKLMSSVQIDTYTKVVLMETIDVKLARALHVAEQEFRARRLKGYKKTKWEER